MFEKAADSDRSFYGNFIIGRRRAVFPLQFNLQQTLACLYVAILPLAKTSHSLRENAIASDLSSVSTLSLVGTDPGFPCIRFYCRLCGNDNNDILP